MTADKLIYIYFWTKIISYLKLLPQGSEYWQTALSGLNI